MIKKIRKWIRAVDKERKGMRDGKPISYVKKNKRKRKNGN
jgi:hypothetical protein